HTPSSTLFPYTTLFRSEDEATYDNVYGLAIGPVSPAPNSALGRGRGGRGFGDRGGASRGGRGGRAGSGPGARGSSRDPSRQRKRSEEHTSELQSRSDLV